MAGFEDILGMLGGTGGDPLSALSLLGMLSQLKGGGMGDLAGLAGMMGGGGFGGNSDASPEDDTIDIDSDLSGTQSDPCHDCRIRCDRANLKLPSYDEVCSMAENWERY